jgi:16S rRNA C967 or C1407 C5-methylase (RsmB/RsmF family)
VRFHALQHREKYFSEQQLRLLTSNNGFTGRLVKPGGILIYSTCSIDPEENEKRITAFVQRHPVLLHIYQHGFFC